MTGLEYGAKPTEEDVPKSNQSTVTFILWTRNSHPHKLKMTEEEMTRIVTAMLSQTETSAKINLIKFGYQDKEEPTDLSFYFKSFDGKENFKDFVNKYNEKAQNSPENC